MDYTIHNVSDELDAAVRARAAEEQKSMDLVLIEALRKGLDVNGTQPVQRDLSDIFNGPPLEPEVVQALEDQRQIDPELWK